MALNADYYIKKLNLLAHPEGGYYRETYRSEELIPHKALPDRFPAERNFSTGIYFLLEKQHFSAFHKIKSDEMWHFYAGDPLEVIAINALGELTITTIGNNLEQQQWLQHVVLANTYFASRVKQGGSFALAGCTVAPGFDLQDFEMVSRQTLTSLYPQHASIIAQLTRF